MPTFSTRDVAKLLRGSGLVHGDEAASVLETVAPTQISVDEVPAERLFRTYAARLLTLHDQRGAHITDLLDSISELCGRLKRFRGPCSFLEIDCEDTYVLKVLLSADGRHALGCLRVRPTDQWLADQQAPSR